MLLDNIFAVLMKDIIKYKISGQGPPVIIIHGLFGTMDNWRTMAGKLEDHFTIILVDLRNHGRSFWSDSFNYELLAHDVLRLMDHLSLSSADIIGHSMGGKVAIYLGQHFASRVSRLVVIDIGYKTYPPGHLQIFDAVLTLDLENVTSRSEADQRLSESINNFAVRQFLLKSLKRGSQLSFVWKTNFQSLFKNYGEILSEVEVDKIQAPILFIRGAKSTYITDEDIIDIQRILPNARFVTLDAGHWIHAERPVELFEEIIGFLN